MLKFKLLISSPQILTNKPLYFINKHLQKQNTLQRLSMLANAIRVRLPSLESLELLMNENLSSVSKHILENSSRSFLDDSISMKLSVAFKYIEPRFKIFKSFCVNELGSMFEYARISSRINSIS